MNNDLDEKIDAAVSKMAEQVKATTDGQKALHFSQAALNLAQTKLSLQGFTTGKKN